MLEVWVLPDGLAYDHCFHPGLLRWSNERVVEELRRAVLDHFVDDDRRSEVAALLHLEVDESSVGFGYGPGLATSPSVARERRELLNEALRVLDLPDWKREIDH